MLKKSLIVALIIAGSTFFKIQSAIINLPMPQAPFTDFSAQIDQLIQAAQKANLLELGPINPTAAPSTDLTSELHQIYQQIFIPGALRLAHPFGPGGSIIQFSSPAFLRLAKPAVRIPNLAKLELFLSRLHQIEPDKLLEMNLKDKLLQVKQAIKLPVAKIIAPAVVETATTPPSPSPEPAPLEPSTEIQNPAPVILPDPEKIAVVTLEPELSPEPRPAPEQELKTPLEQPTPSPLPIVDQQPSIKDLPKLAIPAEFYNSALGYPIELDGHTWPTNEHYIQAQKFTYSPKWINLVDTIRTTANPKAAQVKATRNYRPQIDPAWGSKEQAIITKATKAKFNRYPKLKAQLLATEDQILIDANDQTGQNQLGQILMQLRSELQKS